MGINGDVFYHYRLAMSNTEDQQPHNPELVEHITLVRFRNVKDLENCVDTAVDLDELTERLLEEKDNPDAIIRILADQMAAKRLRIPAKGKVQAKKGPRKKPPPKQGCNDASQETEEQRLIRDKIKDFKRVKLPHQFYYNENLYDLDALFFEDSNADSYEFTQLIYPRIKELLNEDPVYFNYILQFLKRGLDRGDCSGDDLLKSDRSTFNWYTWFNAVILNQRMMLSYREKLNDPDNPPAHPMQPFSQMRSDAFAYINKHMYFYVPHTSNTNTEIHIKSPPPPVIRQPNTVHQQNKWASINVYTKNKFKDLHQGCTYPLQVTEEMWKFMNLDCEKWMSVFGRKYKSKIRGYAEEEVPEEQYDNFVPTDKEGRSTRNVRGRPRTRRRLNTSKTKDITVVPYNVYLDWFDNCTDKRKITSKVFIPYGIHEQPPHLNDNTINTFKGWAWTPSQLYYTTKWESERFVLPRTDWYDRLRIGVRDIDRLQKRVDEETDPAKRDVAVRELDEWTRIRNSTKMTFGELWCSFVKSQWCSGDPVTYNNLVGFITYLFVNPIDKPDWMVLIKGPEGSGKSSVLQMLCSILSKQSHTWIHADYHFKSDFTIPDLGEKLVIIFEEMKSTGTTDQANLSKFKTFITEHEIWEHNKGKDRRPVENYIHVFGLSNDNNALGLHNETARRYFVLQSKADFVRDDEFWRFFQEKSYGTGALESLMFMFIDKDQLEDWSPRTVPVTEALMKEHMLNMDATTSWLYDTLMKGEQVPTLSTFNGVTNEIDREFCPTGEGAYILKALEDPLPTHICVLLGKFNSVLATDLVSTMNSESQWNKLPSVEELFRHFVEWSKDTPNKGRFKTVIQLEWQQKLLELLPEAKIVDIKKMCSYKELKERYVVLGSLDYVRVQFIKKNLWPKNLFLRSESDVRHVLKYPLCDTVDWFAFSTPVQQILSPGPGMNQPD